MRSNLKDPVLPTPYGLDEVNWAKPIYLHVFSGHPVYMKTPHNRRERRTSPTASAIDYKVRKGRSTPPLRHCNSKFTFGQMESYVARPGNPLSTKTM